MRAYRFVNELGIAADAAGRAVATAADVTDSHEGGLVEPAPAASRAGAELLRQLSRAVDGRDHERVTFEARSVRTDGTAGPGFDLGIVVSVDVPTYRGTNAAVTAVTPAESLFEGEHDEALDDRLTALSDGAETPFLLVVGDTNVRAYPGRSVQSLLEDRTVSAVETHLYGRSLRRFVETLAEGFVGEATTQEGPTASDDRALRKWARSRTLDGAVAIRIAATPDQTESTLEAFLED